MTDIHGVIACAGDGTRFASSVVKPYPYPKHLEMIGDKTVLERAFDGLLGNVPVDTVTFTLNPEMTNLYVSHIRNLQDAHPEIQLSYAPAIELENQKLFSNIRTTISNGVYLMDGKLVDIKDPIVAIGLGDLVVTSDNREKITSDIQRLTPDILNGSSMAIYRDIKRGGLMYWLSRVNELEDTKRAQYQKEASDYGLKWWNCNTIEELNLAKLELGYSLNEDKIWRLQSHHGRERA